MLGLFNETTHLTAGVAAANWTPTGAPAVNANQDQSWQGVYVITTDGPIHILLVDESSSVTEVTTSNGARIPADWPMAFAVDMGDTLHYIRGADATQDVNVWITRVYNK